SFDTRFDAGEGRLSEKWEDKEGADEWKEGEEREEDVLQRSRRNSNDGHAVVPSLSESSVNVGNGSSAMTGSYPGVTAGGDSSGDVGAVHDNDGGVVDVEAFARMRVQVVAVEKQTRDAEEG
ncbi:unnamed protein product, partial [Scytosiphon promiscuus]